MRGCLGRKTEILAWFYTIGQITGVSKGNLKLLFVLGKTGAFYVDGGSNLKLLTTLENQTERQK